MKIAIFVDGKNFYSGYKARAEGRKVDFARLAAWVVKQAGGTSLWGAYYYTGIETADDAAAEQQQRLSGFLDRLEEVPGFFVYRFPRGFGESRCQSCGVVTRYSKEKEVDTTMVADMLRLAAVGAFDALVLVSGDADLTPAVEGVRALGKQAFVASWSGVGLSRRSRKAAFDHIDLTEGLLEFSEERHGRSQDRAGAVIPSGWPDDDGESEQRAAEEEFLLELKRAAAQFAGGYVGTNHFVSKWQAERLTPSLPLRQRILDHLLEQGRVELYTAADGAKALRLVEPSSGQP
jgi:uncharacterized LabA/DUF88 family protein